ncbi:universal stress protein [Aquincola sp. S2]|uniref:Universal stress protein n=1 Tax=Pseudaquabacterium terrae TaxID=2732868 RepID=A0ABX2EQP4_9BURK|nr:universal stress protein [Aquabacterium terrae]NRF70977.1 universal stress protein [Aquabacterium terrae]
MKILLAVDGSPTTTRMLAYIAAHDELLGAGHQFTALTVVPAVPPGAATWIDSAVLQGWYDEQAQRVLSPVCKFAAQKDWHLEPRHAVGHAGEMVAAIAQEGGFDLIVMGTHGHSAIGNVVLGSAATRVLAGTRIPVLLVH